MAKHRRIKNTHNIIISLLIIIITVLSAIASYLIIYSEKIYPNIKIVGINVGGYKVGTASTLLSEKVNTPSNIALYYQDQTFAITTSDIKFGYDFENSAKLAYDYTRTGNIGIDFVRRITLLFQPVNLTLEFKYSQPELTKITSVISGQISVDPVEPKINFNNGQIKIEKGTAGKEVNQQKLFELIKGIFTSNISSIIEIPVDIIDNSLTQVEAEALLARVQQYIGKGIELKFEYQKFNLSDKEVLLFLDPKYGYKNSEIDKLFKKISVNVNRDPQNPKFVFEDNKVTEFQPALDGIKIDEVYFYNAIISNLDTLANSTEKVISFEIPVITTPPDIATDKVNDLGIKELIGRGTSTYFHSIPGRVHNVTLAASRINGTLVAPQETFSFNKSLGDVSAFTGYQQAYIISGGKTILGDGGGVCQVSSTFFRALLNAGMSITERTAHAYRVGYYEQSSPPGFDATVYGPSPDLKFVNDTSTHILIQAKADPKNYSLIFELYGTKDGRIATLTKPIVSNISPALPTVYQDDPTLPVGTTKQVDYGASGAKVTFDYSVEKNGEVVFKKTFVSNYRPWAAVYLRGTKI